MLESSDQVPTQFIKEQITIVTLKLLKHKHKHKHKHKYKHNFVHGEKFC